VPTAPIMMLRMPKAELLEAGTSSGIAAPHAAAVQQIEAKTIAALRRAAGEWF
jgi:hypothetical protein